jgi:hypothetical protein
MQTLVILLHNSPKLLTSKVHYKGVKKANYFRVFSKFCENYTGVT